jgi:hypothetical protein
LHGLFAFAGECAPRSKPRRSMFGRLCGTLPGALFCFVFVAGAVDCSFRVGNRQKLFSPPNWGTRKECQRDQNAQRILGIDGTRLAGVCWFDFHVSIILPFAGWSTASVVLTRSTVCMGQPRSLCGRAQALQSAWLFSSTWLDVRAGSRPPILDTNRQSSHCLSCLFSAE